MNAGGDWTYHHYRTADLLSKVTPRRFAYWVGLRVADVAYRKDARGRSAVVSNLRHILQSRGIEPSQETLDKLARRTFGYFGKYCVDFFQCSRMSPSRVRRRVSFEGMHHVREAADAGRGVIMVSAHFGNWELGGAALAALGYRMTAVSLPHPNSRIEALFQHRRESRGIRAVPLGSAAREVLRALRRREAVCLLADRDYTTHARSVPFFGTPARFPVGPARLSVTSGAPVVAGFTLRQEDDTYLTRFHPPIFPRDGAGVDEVQRRICADVEKEVAANPCQWFMFEDFWRSDAKAQERP